MPVSFRPSPAISITQCQNVPTPTPEPSVVLKDLRSKITNAPEINELLKAPLIPQLGPFGSPLAGFIPKRNGLVQTITAAYNQHHALVLRPDDIWLCILTQFNLFVNGKGRAEQLRSVFVAHEGKKELVVRGVGNRYSADYGGMAKQMTKLIEENVVDPSLRTWIIPSFTTTTDTDVVVASVVMMATLQTYFNYRFCLTCGIPQVTLLGEKDDWEQIVRRIEKLKEYGPETTAWHRLLKPVVTRFAQAFDDGVADSADNRDFWNRVAHWQSMGSGPTYLSGWITAFCAFSDEGKWLGGNLNVNEDQDAPTPIIHHPSPGSNLSLDGVTYHRIDSQSIPSAHAEVPVILDDNGEIVPSRMFAGLIGACVSDSGQPDALGKLGTRDQLSPAVGWSFFSIRE